MSFLLRRFFFIRFSRIFVEYFFFLLHLFMFLLENTKKKVLHQLIFIIVKIIRQSYFGKEENWKTKRINKIKNADMLEFIHS